MKAMPDGVRAETWNGEHWQDLDRPWRVEWKRHDPRARLYDGDAEITTAWRVTCASKLVASSGPVSTEKGDPP